MPLCLLRAVWNLHTLRELFCQRLQHRGGSQRSLLMAIAMLPRQAANRRPYFSLLFLPMILCGRRGLRCGVPLGVGVSWPARLNLFSEETINPHLFGLMKYRPPCDHHSLSTGYWAFLLVAMSEKLLFSLLYLLSHHI